MTWQNSAITITTFMPILGAVVILCMPKEKDRTIRGLAILFTGIALALSIAIAIGFNYSQAGLQYVLNVQWIPVIGARYHVGIDGISLPLYLLTFLLSFLCAVYSWRYIPEAGRTKAFLSLMLLLEVGMAGTFIAFDLILFFVFWELVLVPMYFLIGIWGSANREYASIKFFLFTLFGSALMLLSFLAMFFLSKVHTFDIVTLSKLHGAGIVHGTQLLVFAGMFLGFAIKVQMFPFHTWLPDAHTEAPTVGSVLLAAIMLKLGTYGFIRIALPMLPSAAQSWAPWIGLLAVIGIIYGALCCLAQRDMKRLIAFSSVAHMGFVMLGIATLTTFGINAAIFGMVAHGLITGMLFFLAGSIQERYGTREMSRLGGLLTQAPHLGWLLGFSAMASLGLPGLAGFWGEFPSILSSYDPKLPFGLWGGLDGTLWTFRTYMVIAAIGTVLAAGYLLWMFQRVAMGSVKPEFEHAHIHDVHVSEWIAWAPLLLLIVALGLYPQLLFKITDPAVKELVRGMGVALHFASRSL